MKDLYIKALEAYIDMLHIHIDTKTKETDFHQETEAFYETLFDVAHKIGEKHVDLGNRIEEGKMLSEQKQNAYSIIQGLKNEIKSYYDKNELSLGTEDLLGSLSNDLEDIEGTSKSFLHKK